MPARSADAAAGQGACDGPPDRRLRGHLGYHIKRAYNVVAADLAQTLRPFDLRIVTYSALVVIVDTPGIRLSQLAEVLAVERPNLVVIVDELERRALVHRDRVPEDRRAYALTATPEGRSLCEAASIAVAAHEARICAGLDPETRATVTTLLERLQGLPAAR